MSLQKGLVELFCNLGVAAAQGSFRLLMIAVRWNEWHRHMHMAPVLPGFEQRQATHLHTNEATALNEAEQLEDENYHRAERPHWLWLGLQMGPGH